MHKRAEYPRKVNRRKENARTFRGGRLTNRQLLFLPECYGYERDFCVGRVRLYDGVERIGRYP